MDKPANNLDFLDIHFLTPIRENDILDRFFDGGLRQRLGELAFQLPDAKIVSYIWEDAETPYIFIEVQTKHLNVSGQALFYRIPIPTTNINFASVFVMAHRQLKYML